MACSRRAQATPDGAVAAFWAPALTPIAAGDDNANAPRGSCHAASRHEGRDGRSQAQVNVDFNNIGAARRLAGLMRENVKDPVASRRCTLASSTSDPFDAETRTAYGRVLMQQNKADAAAQEFKAVVAMNPVDDVRLHGPC